MCRREGERERERGREKEREKRLRKKMEFYSCFFESSRPQEVIS